MAAAAYAQAGMAGFQIINGLQQADMMRAQASLQRQIGDMNAEFAELDAFNAEADGLTQVGRYQTVIDATLADQAAILASKGMDTSFGSAGEMVKETKLNGFLNTLDMQNQARTRALGMKREARGMRMNASFAEAEARGRASAVQTQAVISGARTLASGYMRGDFGSASSSSPATKVTGGDVESYGIVKDYSSGGYLGSGNYEW